MNDSILSNLESRSQIHPQSGTHSEISVNDIEAKAEAEDRPVRTDVGRVPTATAGRPQPPPTTAVIIYGCTLRLRIGSCCTYSVTIGSK